MKKFTVEEIVGLNPRWTGQRIRNLVASYGGSVDVIDVLLCDEVSDVDAVWVADRDAPIDTEAVFADCGGLKMGKFTADDIIAFEPCWLEESDGEQRIRNLVASYGGSVDVIDVLLCDEVSDVDAVWVADRLATPQQARLATALFAEIILDAEVKAGRTPDARSFAAIEVARRHAVGQATDEELRETYEEAHAAAREACESSYMAALAAARAVIYNNARAAIYNAADAVNAICACIDESAGYGPVNDAWRTLRKLFLQIVEG